MAWMEFCWVVNLGRIEGRIQVKVTEVLVPVKATRPRIDSSYAGRGFKLLVEAPDVHFMHVAQVLSQFC